MPGAHLLDSHRRHQGLLEKWYRGPAIPLYLGVKWCAKCMEVFFWDGGSINFDVRIDIKSIKFDS